MTALATTADLSSYLVATGQPALTQAQLPGAQLLLDAISEAVRAETGHRFDGGLSIVELQGLWLDDSECASGRRDLVLPQQPVQSVVSVLIDGVAVTDYTLRGGALWRDLGWPGWVTVTFVHGSGAAPDDVRGYILMCSAEGLRGATPLKSERIAEYDYERGDTLPGDHLGLGVAALKRRYPPVSGADVMVRSSHR